MEPADVLKTAFAMPLTSPSFARGPYRYTNREYLIVTYRTSRAALEEAVPEPLTFDEPLVRCEFMRTRRLENDSALCEALRWDPSSAQTKDGLPPGEGVFIACSFWLADVYVLQGRSAEARQLFERLRGLCNDVGLLSEEYDPAARRMLGNFPPGLQPYWADQHGAEPGARRGAGGRTRGSGER